MWAATARASIRCGGRTTSRAAATWARFPDRLPGFQHVEVDEFRAKFERRWGVPIPPKRGWHLSEMFEAMERGEFRALYVLGENPLQSEADQAQTRHRLESLDFLIVQDIFLTATAQMATVVFPAAAGWCESDGTVTNSERRVQRVRKALDPPAGARDDCDDPLRSRAADGARLGRTEGRDHLERSPRTQPASRRDELRAAGGRQRDSSGPVTTTTIRASCFCTAGSGSDPSMARGSPFNRSNTTLPSSG